MKTYIIFTPEITNMGGAQMYTANKVKFLKFRGWNVQVFFPKNKGDIKILELQEFANNYIPELSIPFQYISEKNKKCICSKISSVCNNDEELVFESQIITQSFIIEDLAIKFGARHIINTVDERISQSFPNQTDFFEYKLRRWEFQNAGERRLKQIFGSHYKEDFKNFENVMVYKCGNVVSDDGKTYDFAKADYTILSIGRLDKPYIMPMTEDIRMFANSYSDKTINVIYVGGSFSGEEEGKVENILRPVKNVNLYMMGYTFPVSKSILETADVAIACANSVRVSADQDIPTIVADMNDSMAVGVFGYNTNNMFRRQSEPAIPICQYLEDVLVFGKYPRRGATSNYMDDMAEAFERELVFIDKSKGNSGYYDVDSFVSTTMKIKGVAFRMKQMFSNFAHK